MSLRRVVVYAGLTVALSALMFSFGGWMAQRAMAAQIASNDARLTALQDDLARNILRIRQDGTALPSGTGGQLQGEAVVPAAGSAQSALVDEIKRQLQAEMGLLPVRLLRERRESFVELNAVDNFGKVSYGTAGYLGNGYFITVKHGVVALGDDGEGRAARRIESVTIRYNNRDVPATIVDSGDATVEVHSGDWAIIQVKASVNLPALRVNPAYGFEFAEPIFRLGNDYSKGIILSTGYVGQRISNGMVTCLTDGHPGVSGGGVLDQQGDLVGIPVGRMQGDYRFSFILPIREEMFRKIPTVVAMTETVAAAR